MLAAPALDWPEVGAVKEHGSLQMAQVWRLVVGLGEKHVSLNKVGLVVHVSLLRQKIERRFICIGGQAKRLLSRMR